MIHAKPVLSEAEGALRREEVSENFVHAETRSRGGVALAAQRLSHSLASTDLLPANAGTPSSSFSSAAPRLRANKILLNLFTPSRLRVNQFFSGTPHV